MANNGLSNCITKDGQTTVTQNIPLSGNKLTGVGDATALTDAMNVKGLQNGSFVNLSSVSGTDTITATVTPVPSAYASGQMFVFVPANTNTGATTINISSLGAKNIFLNGSALSGGELVAGVPVGIRYDGTQFEVMFVGQVLQASANETITGNWIYTGVQIINRNSPLLEFKDADGTSTHSTTRLIENNGLFSVITLDDARATVSTDYRITKDASGATSHEWRVGNTARLKLESGLYTPNATGGDQGADTVNASELYEDGARVLRIVTGTYTGDGNATQAVTGLGLQPKYLKIAPRITANNTVMDVAETWDVVSDDSAAGGAIAHNAAASGSNHRFIDDAIVSLDSDGFTVGDQSTGITSQFNVNGNTYNYIAWG